MVDEQLDDGNLAEDEEDSVLDSAVQEDILPEISVVPEPPEPQTQVTISLFIVSVFLKSFLFYPHAILELWRYKIVNRSVY